MRLSTKWCIFWTDTPVNFLLWRLHSKMSADERVHVFESIHRALCNTAVMVSQSDGDSWFIVETVTLETLADRNKIVIGNLWIFPRRRDIQ